MIGIHNAIVGNKAQGLPSAEDWTFGGIPNIIKTPVTSIEVPRKIRVGADNFLLEANEDAGDRLCDTILPFARGVNPMVAVQMQNSGNVHKNAINTSLPYKIQAFRPPIVKLEDTMPLSRLNRLPTKVVTLPKIQSGQKPYQEIKELQSKPLFVEYTLNPIARATKEFQTQHVALNRGLVQTRSYDVQKNLKRLEKIEFNNPRVYLPDPLSIGLQAPVSTKAYISHIDKNQNANRYLMDNQPISVQTLKTYNLNNIPDLPEYELETVMTPISVETQKNYFKHDLPEMPEPILNTQRISIDYNTNKNLNKKYKTYNLQTNGKRIQVPIKVHYTNTGYKHGNYSEKQITHNPVQVSTRENMSIHKEEYERNVPVTKDRAVSRYGYQVG
jgi:hypothetical protein